MKLVFMTWGALFSGMLSLAQTPVPPVPQEPSQNTAAPKVQKPPAAQGAPVAPNRPFESSPAPAPGSPNRQSGATPTGSPGSETTQPPPAEGAAATRSAAPAAATTTNAGNGEGKKPYLIGPLDVLEIRVWNDQKMSGIFDVRPDGMISMNLIGEMRADGLTVADLTKVIVAKLSDLMNSPEVNVQVVRVNSKKYFIFGEVVRGGEFPLIADTTVLEALSSAGGFREFANTKKIYVLRGTKRLPFNYKNVSHGKNMEQNVLLENGDKIFVP